MFGIDEELAYESGLTAFEVRVLEAIQYSHGSYSKDDNGGTYKGMHYKKISAYMMVCYGYVPDEKIAIDVLSELHRKGTIAFPFSQDPTGDILFRYTHLGSDIVFPYIPSECRIPEEEFLKVERGEQQ